MGIRKARTRFTYKLFFTLRHIETKTTDKSPIKSTPHHLIKTLARKKSQIRLSTYSYSLTMTYLSSTAVFSESVGEWFHKKH